MKPANGPLETGTYVGYAAVHPGQYHVAQKDSGETKLGLTQNLEHEGIKVGFETVKMSNSGLG